MSGLRRQLEDSMHLGRLTAFELLSSSCVLQSSTVCFRYSHACRSISAHLRRGGFRGPILGHRPHGFGTVRVQEPIVSNLTVSLNCRRVHLDRRVCDLRRSSILRPELLIDPLRAKMRASIVASIFSGMLQRLTTDVACNSCSGYFQPTGRVK